MRVGSVTQRWTEALFSLAKRLGVLDEVRRDTDRIGVELSSEKVSSYLFNPQVDRAKKRALLEKLSADFHPITRQFVGLALDRRREEILTSVAVAFRRRMLAEQQAVEGIVESARPLEAAEIEKLAAAVGKRLGKRVELGTRINESLIGGVRIFADNRMIDYSVKGRLETLEKKLYESPLPQTTAHTG